MERKQENKVDKSIELVPTYRPTACYARGRTAHTVSFGVAELPSEVEGVRSGPMVCILYHYCKGMNNSLVRILVSRTVTGLPKERHADVAHGRRRHGRKVTATTQKSRYIALGIPNRFLLPPLLDITAHQGHNTTTTRAHTPY